MKNAPAFQQFTLPEKGTVTGYAAIVDKLELPIPIPVPIALVSEKTKGYETDEFKVFPNRYALTGIGSAQDLHNTYKHLVFALKYEGVNLLVFRKLAQYYSTHHLETLINIEPTGRYSRICWFLFEWLSEKRLENKGDLSKKAYVPVINEKLQFAITGYKSARHKVINNISGTSNFAPLVRKTEQLKDYQSKSIRDRKSLLINEMHKDILQRATAYLLLKDSKASFTIEGEKPKSKRAALWGVAIGQAGRKPLNEQEIIRLQRLVIGNKRFIKIGIRKSEGFIGDRDRLTNEPIPEHISAKSDDLGKLMSGWYACVDKLITSKIDPIVAAAIISFGFVFIHPLVDGNGRIHRYLIHDILAKMDYTTQGMIFPVSSSILNNIADYQKVLSAYSLPLLSYIDWETTPDKNVKVLNETIDFYRFFDATAQAEFLYKCVEDTIENIIPQEAKYLKAYDEFKAFVDDHFAMPDNMVSLLVNFLNQGDGRLSKRAKNKEFSAFSESEIANIEKVYAGIFKAED